MKILMVLESDFPPDVRVENELNSLSAAGHELHIACYSKKKSFRIPDNLPYTIHKKFIPALRLKSSVGSLKFGFYFRFWKLFLKMILDKEKFDAIHIHDLPLARVGFELSRQYHLKFVLDLHENWPALLDISIHTKTFLGRILCSISQWEKYERKYAAKADQIIVVVEEARERLAEIGIPPGKISVVSNTLNIDMFDFPAQKKDPEFVTLVYVGGINYHRGLQFVIRALPAVKEKIPNIRFLIIGDGNYLPALKALTSSLHLESCVSFAGWKKQKEALELASRGDYAVIPHIRSPHTDATIPHKIFQYMYAGIPIISSDCKPLKRILDETRTGVCFSDQDPVSFASTLLKLHHDPGFLEAVPANGRKCVEEKYNWEQEARELKKIYTP